MIQVFVDVAKAHEVLLFVKVLAVSDHEDRDANDLECTDGEANQCAPVASIFLDKVFVVLLQVDDGHEDDDKECTVNESENGIEEARVELGTRKDTYFGVRTHFGHH